MEIMWLMVIFLQIIFTSFSNSSYVINTLLAVIVNDLDYLNISIALIMLCATLSMLSFSYYSINDEKNKKDKIKECGESFFIATILSAFSLINLYLFSLMKPQLDNIGIVFNLMLLEKFLLLNILIIFLIIFLITMLYTLYYLIYGSISSLKVLNFNILD